MNLETGFATRFSTDYKSARDKFHAATALVGGSLRSYANPLRGPGGEALATDVAWFGPEDAAKVLVTVSATHGVEGFCGSGAQIDWLLGPGTAPLPADTAMLFVHAINPYGFAWLRRVTEEGCDLNRNFIDFGQPLPENPAYDELADALVPRTLSGPEYEAAIKRLEAYREKHGPRQFDIARSAGQYRHPGGIFYGGIKPTWARLTLEAIIADYHLAARRLVAVVDYHTGLGPFGYGEPISGNIPGSLGHKRGRAWYGDSLTEPTLGTSSSVPKRGLADEEWCRKLGDAVTYIALEYGTYPSSTSGMRALREDHWLHNYSNVDWSAPETRRIKAQIRKHYYPATPDWQEMVLFRSRQVLRQALAGLMAG
ncbi:MAG TPA: M14 family metallopeptidase [Alphaproteobacteria bacterium]|nr:M14 family metallopeptidase [Alphaproteobacteria bacterium]